MKAYRREAVDYLMSFADDPKEDVFKVALSQIGLLIKDVKEYFEQKYKKKIEKMIDETKEIHLKNILESVIRILEGQE